MSDSTGLKRPRKARKTADERPPKPYKDFPLTPHASGAWQKKIRGKSAYFGKWGKRVNGKMERLPGDGWKEALDQYNIEKDDIFAGRTPRVKGEGLTVGDLRGRFLTAKSRALDATEITSRTYFEYRTSADRLLSAFGENRLVDDLSADDFETLRADLAKTCGPVRLGNEIQRVRTFFKYGYESGLMDKPVRYGPQFKKPSKSVLRKHKATKGSRLFEAAEILKLLAKSPTQLKAMVLLGINCGFGNSDCGSLPQSAVDFENRWINFPRPKTGVDRRCRLWPETVAAIKAAIAERPNVKNEPDTDLVFITKYGSAWTKDVADSPVTKFTRKLLDELDIYRAGLGFYALRHTFRTVAVGTKDFPAVRLIMGHADDSIDDTYREKIEDTRLTAIADHVHAWLWPFVEKPKKDYTAKKKPKNATAKRAPKRTPKPFAQAESSDFRLRIVG